MSFTRSQATEILQRIIPSSTLIGLHVGSNDPTKDEIFVEPSPQTGYARTTFGAQNTDEDAQIANDEIIFFNESVGAGYGHVTHFGLFSSASSNTPFFIGEVKPAITIGAEFIPIFRKYQLIIGLDRDPLETNYGDS